MCRVHTNITRLPCQYRQFIRLQGKEVKSIDVSACQPITLSLFLLNTSPSPSIRVFLDDALSGCLYERIGSAAGLTRQEAKDRFWVVAYGHPGDQKTKFGNAVRSLCPGLLEEIAKRYWELGRGGTSEGDAAPGVRP